MEILQHQTKRKAKKEHKCYFCNGKIAIGETYHYSVQINDEFATFKSHISCDELISKMKMYDDVDRDEGLSDDDFREHILQDFRSEGLEDCDYDFDEALAMAKEKYDCLELIKESVMEVPCRLKVCPNKLDCKSCGFFRSYNEYLRPIKKQVKELKE